MTRFPASVEALALPPAARRLAGHVAAYAASEVFAKASRLLTVVAMARCLDAGAIGVAAAALATGEIMKALAENGVGQRVIAAPAEDLDATVNGARRIFWAWCIALALLQCGVAGVLYLAGGNALTAGLIALLALEYLIMPAALVQCALAMREGKLRQTAIIAGAQNVGANVVTALLLIVWPSPLAVVVGKLSTAPLWLVAMRRLRPWTASAAPALPVRAFAGFVRAAVAIELVRAARQQGDKLIIGGVLGLDALGVYFFAVSAGLGLATSFSTALSTVLFPHLSHSTDRGADARRATLLSVAFIAPVVFAQALMAPLYVPLVFGAGWGDVAPLVSILCLAAIPAVLWAVTAQYLRADGRINQEFVRAALLAAVMTVATLAAAPYGLTAVAWTILIAATVSHAAVCLPLLIATPKLPLRLAAATAR
ncbi:oligosaccharide flippase family protein [Acuticoccus sp. MNP-M23]|uniref:oligosaccharide flippase family protein n=1 Tax=Acuticoccus sp. MNP-M23 TaxID=3072793 RepID=UPI00281637D0|nr:oligosaccharide flippase family protein [Acuticoccus sp. MNP-M23]WMS42793.1 oligosaccharide flippase family protein [Acuticoccus sp. MNP-M23]